MAEQLVPVGITLFETFCLLVLFDTFFDRRVIMGHKIPVFFHTSLIFLVTIFVGYAFSAEDLNQSSVPKVLIYLVAFLGVVHLLYCGKVARKIIIVITSYLLGYFVDYFGFLILSLLGFGDKIGLHNITETVLIVGALKVSFFLSILILRYVYTRFGKKYHSNLISISNRAWILIFSMPILSLASMWVIVTLIPQNHQSNPLLLSVSLGWIFVCILVFKIVIFSANQEYTERENAIIHERVQKSVEYAISEKRNADTIMTMCHDFRHHMNYISGLIRENNFTEAQNYIDTVYGSINIVNRVDANTSLVNSILNEKLSVAYENNIGVTVQISDLSKLTFSDEDVVIMLSNLLDNAIEACQKIKSNRYIKLKFMFTTNGDIVLSIRNSYDGRLIKQGEKLISTKTSSDSHGLGVSSVIQRIKKNEGQYAISHDGNEFQITAFFPCSARKNNRRF